MGEGPLSRSTAASTRARGAPSSHVSVPDQRPGDRSLRVSWHPDTSTVVFSHWVEGLCVASTPVTVSDAAEVLRFLDGALPVEASSDLD